MARGVTSTPRKPADTSKPREGAPIVNVCPRFFGELTHHCGPRILIRFDLSTDPIQPAALPFGLELAH